MMMMMMMMMIWPEGNMWAEGVIFGRGQYDVNTVQYIASVHEISSPYSFCYLIIRNVH